MTHSSSSTWIWLALGGAVLLSLSPDRRGLVGWGALAALTSFLVIVGVGSLTAVLWMLGSVAIVVILFRRGADSPLRPRAVSCTITCVVAYIFVLVAVDAVASRQVLEAAEARGLSVADVMVAPLPGNPFRSEVVVLTDDAYVPGTHRWLGSSRVVLDPDAAVALLAAPDGRSTTRTPAIVEAARAQPTVRDYLVWSRYPYVRVTPEGDGWRVRFSDPRYDGRPEAGGLAGVSVDVPDSEIP